MFIPKEKYINIRDIFESNLINLLKVRKVIRDKMKDQLCKLYL